MAFYYDVDASFTTSGTANTETDAARYATGTTRTCSLMRFESATTGVPVDAQILAKLWTMSTASTAGSAFTPKPKDKAAQAAVTTVSTSPTIGTKDTNPSLILPYNSRGRAVWFATSVDEVIFIQANAGANGNIDVLMEASAISVATRHHESFWE